MITRWLCIAALIGTVPAYGLDLHLQELPAAPGLQPSEPLDPLSGLKEAVNCGLDFLNTAKACGLSAPAVAVSPFLVSFDPLYCRLTMRFPIGELIDGLLKQWIAGAFARLNSPVIGALCLLGIGPQFCGAASTATTPTLFNAAVRPGAVQSQDALAPTREPAVNPSSLDATVPTRNTHERTGLDSLTR